MFRKRKCQLLWFAGATVFLASGTVLGAGLDGAYYGVTAGGFMAKTTTDQSINKPLTGNSGLSHANTIAGFSSLDPSPKQTGILGGARLGYNWRAGPLVVGAELAANLWGYRSSATESTSFAVNNGTRTLTSTNSAQAAWVLTLQPRLGYAFSDTSMVYGSVGLAYSDLKYSNVSTAASNPSFGTSVTYVSSATKNTGVVFGLGYERAWSATMSLRIEYQHLDFGRTESRGTTDITFTDLQDSSLTTGYKTKVDMLRLSANWQF